MLDGYIKKLIQELNLGQTNLESDVPGTYSLPIGELSVKISAIPDGIYLRCDIAPFPMANGEALATDMMSANLFGQGTRDSVLGLTIDGKSLTLTRAIDYNINYGDFKNMLEDFINVVDLWHDEALTHK